MYRRTNSRDASELGHYISRVVEEEEDESEEDDHLQSSQDYMRPQLDPISEGMYIKIGNVLSHTFKELEIESCY